MPKMYAVAWLLASLVVFTTAQSDPDSCPVPLNSTFSTFGTRDVRYDTGTYGPPIEEFHYFYNEWPSGIAVSKTGRVFISYPRGGFAYTVGEVVNITAERPYPNQAMNSPLGGVFTFQKRSGINAIASNDTTRFISVEGIFITPDDTLWILDTGRPLVHENEVPVLLNASVGGTKLVAMNLASDTVQAVYTFPTDVAYPDSYLNDLRIDIRPNVTQSGKGIAYITDSSRDGRNGFVILDLGTGQSWRMLDDDHSTMTVNGDVPSYQGIPFYKRPQGLPVGYQSVPVNGMELSIYGNKLYYSPLTSNYLYSIETKYLRSNPAVNSTAPQIASANVQRVGMRGGQANGFSTDDNGLLYMLMPESNAIYFYNPTENMTFPFVRDPRNVWPDSASTGWDGYLYWTVNQLPYHPDWNDGIDYRQYPGLILRARMPDSGTRNTLGL